MERFLENGHLTNEILAALAADAPLSELERLEIAEHLAFCNECLSRYTDCLSEDTLLTPGTSCELTLWRRVRERTIRLVSSRWATAAAALAIVFSLWGFGVFGGVVDVSARLAQERSPGQLVETQNYSGRWSDAMSGFFDKLGQTLDSAFDGGTGKTPDATNGGNHHAA